MEGQEDGDGLKCSGGQSYMSDEAQEKEESTQLKQFKEIHKVLPDTPEDRKIF